MKFEIINGEVIRYPNGDKRGYYLSAMKNKHEIDILSELLDMRRAILEGTGDNVFGIEGPTDSGKTTLNNLLAYILTLGKFDPKKDICTDLVTLVKRINNANRGDYVALEEAQGILTAGTGKALKILIELIKVCRKKGVILAIITPKFIDLKKYVVLERSSFLFRTYFRNRRERTGKGNFVLYNEEQKADLYDRFQKKEKKPYANTSYSCLGRFGDFDLYERDAFKQGIMDELIRKAEEVEGKKDMRKDNPKIREIKYKLSILYEKFKANEFPNKRDFYKFIGYDGDTFNLWKKEYRNSLVSSKNDEENPNNSLENGDSEPI